MSLKSIHAEIANHCGDISELFKRGAKVTVLVRNPGLDDGDMLVSDDDLTLAIAALERLKAKEKTKLTPLDVIKQATGMNP